MWPNTSFIDLIGIKFPIIQAPMAGASGADMVVATCEAGGLGSLPCAMLEVEKFQAEFHVIRQRTNSPVNLNFFCHAPAGLDPDRETAWKNHLAPYYTEYGLDTATPTPRISRVPFDENMCAVVEKLQPEVVSFHFGLPARVLLDRVKSAGCIVICSATTVEEAQWLEYRGCDAIIAQGAEAGGHRGMFLTDEVSSQVGTMALVPQVVDAVQVPVIAAGGIADGRGIAAAFALGAAAVQIGTAYLFTPEATITPLHRAALTAAHDDGTALTNLFSGRPARSLLNRVMREIGLISDKTPAFPTAGGVLAPLKAKAEAAGKDDFSSLWSGQAARLGREMGAFVLTQTLASDASERLTAIAARD